MADSSLDDFFAKKDKSKKKNKSKMIPTDILAKQDDGDSDTRKKDKKKKEKEKQTTASSSDEPKNIVKVANDDEEWVDFEQELEKDYSGLRIQNIQISKDQDVLEEENKENEESDEGENSEKKDKMSGPWNAQSQSKSQSQQVSTPLVTKQAPPPEEIPPSKPPEEHASETAKPAKYVPPSVRAAAAAGASPGETSRATPLRRKKVAPNIQSEEDFPTLGGGAAGPMSNNFERVQSGGRHIDDPTKGNLQLSLGNKYAALQD